MVEMYCDGSCYNSNYKNYMGIGVYVLEDKGDVHFHAYTGVGTNNIAEYMAVMTALLYIKNTKMEDEVTIYSDSQLVIYQITGKYKCKKKHLQEILSTIHQIKDSIPNTISFKWVSREHPMQQMADKLSNRGNPHYGHDLEYRDFYKFFKQDSELYNEFNLQKYERRYSHAP